MKRQNITIEKVPLPPEEKLIDRKPNFPKIKTLYLELIENKSKIKPNLVNKDYIPEQNSDSDSKAELKFVENVLLQLEQKLFLVSHSLFKDILYNSSFV